MTQDAFSDLETVFENAKPRSANFVPAGTHLLKIASLNMTTPGYKGTFGIAAFRVVDSQNLQFGEIVHINKYVGKDTNGVVNKAKQEIGLGVFKSLIAAAVGEAMHNVTIEHLRAAMSDAQPLTDSLVVCLATAGKSKTTNMEYVAYSFVGPTKAQIQLADSRGADLAKLPRHVPVIGQGVEEPPF